jgi:hypothetical protein
MRNIPEIDPEIQRLKPKVGNVNGKCRENPCRPKLGGLQLFCADPTITIKASHLPAHRSRRLGIMASKFKTHPRLFYLTSALAAQGAEQGSVLWTRIRQTGGRGAQTMLSGLFVDETT